MRKLVALGLLSAVLLALPCTSYTQERGPLLGRTADGRAFRLDAEGNQIVDYTAELELNVQELTRRVNGLEYEVEEKQRVIDRLQRGAGEGFSERNLLTGKKRQPAARCPAADCSQAVRERVAGCSEELHRLRADLETLKEDRSARTEALRTELQHAQQGGVEAAMLRAELQRMQQAHATELAKLQEQQQRAQQERGVELARLQSELERTRQSRESDLAKLQGELRRAQQLRDQQAAQIANSRLSQRQNGGAAAALLRDGFTASPAIDPRAALAVERERALQLSKRALEDELHKLRALVRSRDELFDEYAKQGRALKVRPSPAVSSRRRTPEMLAQSLTEARSQREIDFLRADLQEIRQRMEDDVKLIRRLSGSAQRG